ncbi:Type IIS restriction enzyme Eco57I, partial [termite gut metagenome]
GHFLVSALNEMIFLKSELGILTDKSGKPLKDYRVAIENDELIITNSEGDYFAYNPQNIESQRVQETFFHEKQTVIENCLFGVDINPNSVKICQLRLWIELLKHTYYRSGTNELETLPNIDINIKCGNSLISRFDLHGNYSTLPLVTQQKLQRATREYKDQVVLYKCMNDKATKKLTRENIARIKDTFNQINNPTDVDYRKWKEVEAKSTAHFTSLRFDEDKDGWNKQLELLQAKTDTLREKYEQKIKTFYSNAFEWSFEFPEVLDDNGNFIGFDAVIGNPPYMRVQTIRNSYPKLADKYEELYKSATGSYDIYAFFAEKSLSLVKESGVINFIMPVKWTNATFGKGLRSVITTNRAISKIINFGSYQVFDASTYTGLQWFQKNSDNLLYLELDKNFKTNEELNHFLNTVTNNNFHQIPSSTLAENTWTLSNGTIMSILDKLNRQPRRMGDIFDKIFQGIATSKDDVYFLYNCTTEDEYINGYSKQLAETVRIEHGLVKPLLKGEDVHRYETIKTNRFVIFPYKLSNNEAVLYTEDEIKEQFPFGYVYLKRCEEVLRGREKGRFNVDGQWFQYSRKQGLMAEIEKLIAPEISKGGNFSYDKNGDFYSTTTIYGYIKKSDVSENYKCFMAILNSKLFWWFLVNTGTTLANGYFRVKPNYINPFPIPAISGDIEQLLIELVDKIVEIKQLNQRLDYSAIEKDIDKIVYTLYNLSDVDIAIINSQID